MNEVFDDLFSERFIVAVLRWTARVIGIAIFLLIVLLIVLSQIFGGIDNPLNMSSERVLSLWPCW